MTITNSTMNETKNLKLGILNQYDLNTTTEVNARAKSSIWSSDYNKSVASYKVKPYYKETSEKPYSLILFNNKTIVGNQKIIIAGEIYNNGTNVLNLLIVAATLYRSDGTVLSVFLNHVTVEMPPAKTSAFQIEVLKNDFSINIKEITLIEIYAYKTK